MEEGGGELTVQRIYDDFEWLQHSITTENDVGGIIVSIQGVSKTINKNPILNHVISHLSIYHLSFIYQKYDLIIQILKPQCLYHY